MIKFENVVEVKHPLLLHKLSLLRDKTTTHKDFREIINEISGLMIYEATRDLELKDIKIETPIMETIVPVLKGKAPAIVPILRAGLGMVDRILEFIPNAKVGHIGVYRNEETLKPIYYYCKLPENIEQRKVFLVDPMLATGGSGNYAIEYLKNKNVKDITFISILSAPEGLEYLAAKHPDVKFFTAKIDENLNENGYICPGLGDAGDRIFGTK